MFRAAGKISLLLLMVCALALTGTGVTRAGLGDKLKKKAEDKANKEADKAINKADEKTDTSKPSGETPADAGEKSDAPKGSGDVGGVSTKFDYVPGDMVLFFDDFTQDELGEFPANWKLKSGTFEVAEGRGQRWLRCTSTDSDIRMKLPAMDKLPEYWTLEFDALCEKPSGNVWTVRGLNGDKEVWNAVFPMSGRNLAFTSGDVNSNTPLEGDPQVWGAVHHLMFMARGNALKVYVDRQRMANVPEIDVAAGPVTNISWRLWSNEQPMIGNVRFAEGNKPVDDPFASGKLVTYGIYFDSGSDVVKPESAPVLRQIAGYMQKNAAVKIQILGHTDNQGTSDGNMDLSKRRAASVAKVLAEQFKISADRFTTDGMGDTKPIAKNETSEGRAANRRVEFTKI
ncbi:MAG TPA: OmpA family protein [Candidatus Krumholzibacteria bacterium]|nr:OmpA family protein [Candidatus Krumholzibacteria bacterium]